MRTIYLKNGTAAILHKELPDGEYLIEPIYQYDTQEGEYESGNGQKEVVKEIFDRAPVELIDAEYKAACEMRNNVENDLQELTSQKFKLQREIEQTQKTIVNNEKFIINKTELRNAKRLALFPKDDVMPMLLEKDMWELKISFEMKIRENGERAWGYQIYHDRGYGGSSFLDTEYGILIDPTDEQIDDHIRLRLAKNTFSDREIDRTHDKYLSDEQIEGKRQRKAQQVATEIARQEKVIAMAQDALKELKGEN